MLISTGIVSHTLTCIEKPRAIFAANDQESLFIFIHTITPTAHQVHTMVTNCSLSTTGYCFVMNFATFEADSLHTLSRSLSLFCSGHLLTRHFPCLTTLVSVSFAVCLLFSISLSPVCIVSEKSFVHACKWPYQDATIDPVD